jgi:chaperone required for assembly of F1-ATPase
MSEWKAKRFWTEAAVAPSGDGFAVLLDGRPVRTPARRPLEAPTEALARAIADEWQAQEGVINPQTMPFTRMTNSAIDTVAENRAAVVGMIAAYGDSDLLCYRASHPEGLIERQAIQWNPLLDWAEATLSARLQVVVGVMHRPQAAEALATLRMPLERAGHFEIAALHEVVSLSGSLVIGLRLAAGDADPEALWQASRLDEIWQSELWGSDDEAEALAETRRRAFLEAAHYLNLAVIKA